jgi:hypothetical protein
VGALGSVLGGGQVARGRVPVSVDVVILKVLDHDADVPGDNGLRELVASRTIENPGGMAFVADGSLFVVEGAVENGNGKMLEIC